jgi:2-aminobenzoate-CoA ligase
MLPPQADWPDLLPVPGVSYPEFLNAGVELLDANIKQGRGERVAVRCGPESLTYAQLLDRVERVATALVDAGVNFGDRVLLRLPNTSDFIVAWLAIVRMGAVVVPTMPLLRATELRAILEDCGAELAICQDALLGPLEQAAADLPVRIVVAGPEVGGHPSFRQWASVAPTVQPAATRQDDIALFLYTSGSTGVPKGTVHFHRDLLAVADTYCRQVLKPTEADVFGGHPTLAFAYGLGGLLVFPFRAGASTVLMGPFTPESMLTTIRDYGITIVFCTPASYKLMLREYGQEIKAYVSTLRCGVNAGETLPAAVFQEWKERTGGVILDGIGTTEMLHIFISTTLDEARPGCTGKPVPGYEAKVVDADLHEVPPGVPGLLAVRGPTGCRYWDRPDKQQEYVRSGWNFPGDVFVKDEQGHFYYGCRSDDMIVCAGNKIAGPDVENVLMQHPAVKEAAVVASPDELRGFVPKAFIVLAEGHAPQEALAAELQGFVKARIAPFKYPRLVEFVDALPKTPTGKIRRAELRQRELAAQGRTVL